MYERLIRCLTLLGMYEGETSHSLDTNVGHIMNYAGWDGQGTEEYQRRLPALAESDYIAGRLADSVGQCDLVEDQFQQNGDFNILQKGFK